LEYLVGSVITLVSVAVANRLIMKQLRYVKKTQKIKYSQTHVYSLLIDMFNSYDLERLPKTQSTEYQDRAYTKIVVVENRAYWIKDNKFYVADVNDGSVNKDSSEEVDTISMNDVELKKIIDIVEALKQGGTDDNRYPGKS